MFPLQAWLERRPCPAVSRRPASAQGSGRGLDRSRLYREYKQHAAALCYIGVFFIKLVDKMLGRLVGGP